LLVVLRTKRTGFSCAKRKKTRFAFAAKPSESDSRSEAFSSGKRANIRATREIPGTWRRGPSRTPVPTILPFPLALRPKACYNKLRKAVNIVSQFRRLRQQIHNQHNLKIKRQKTVFSTCFIITLIISLIMLVICAINKAPTFTTTVISGCAWLIFDFLFAYAKKTNGLFCLMNVQPAECLLTIIKPICNAERIIGKETVLSLPLV